jgi:hypothetical protein
MNRTTEKLIGTSMMAFCDQGIWKDKHDLAVKVCSAGSLLYLTVAQHNDSSTCTMPISLVLEYTVNTTFRSIYETPCHLRVFRFLQRCIEDVTLRHLSSGSRRFKGTVSRSSGRLGSNRRRSFKRQEPLTQRHGGTSRTEETFVLCINELFYTWKTENVCLFFISLPCHTT